MLPLLLVVANATAQDRMTPELLWSLKRVAAESISDDGKYLYYAVRQYNIENEKNTTQRYVLNIATGKAKEQPSYGDKSIIQRDAGTWYAADDNMVYKSGTKGKDWNPIYKDLQGAQGIKVSPDGKYIAYAKEVKVKPTLAADIYKDMSKSQAYVFTDLNYRHWDSWEDGFYQHIFIASVADGTIKDIMDGEPFDCPQKPFGGDEDFVWAPDSKGLLYVCKKKYGKEYALSTNTDLYYYKVADGTTVNWSVGMQGYDLEPKFSPDGKYLAWTSMSREGFEADKNDIIIMDISNSDFLKINLTEDWDGTVNSFVWDEAGDKIYFNAATKGTVQLFELKIPAAKYKNKTKPAIRQITEGKFDINGLAGQSGDDLVVSRCDMNHASELYAVNIRNGAMRALTHENDDVYNSLNLSHTELRMVETSNGGKMGVWVIYPPGFDPNKKYPTLLYCQGGPQSALSQFYSVRWNFQLMAANGYIVVAPNRTGMPGWGVKWNENISKDWGGQPIRDYLSAIDAIAKEEYVDKDRLGCVGASYGGYSVYMLAGMHNNRFKTFIAHDGLFDLKSWYGTTEELWFANWDIEGPYWNKPLYSSYLKFDPSTFVDKWNTPIMIVQGGQDFRVGIEQGLEAFQAAQLRGIKSKLLYIPNENHWVLHPHNGIVWQREFFKWLDETLK